MSTIRLFERRLKGGVGLRPTPILRHAGLTDEIELPRSA